MERCRGNGRWIRWCVSSLPAVQSRPSRGWCRLATFRWRTRGLRRLWRRLGCLCRRPSGRHGRRLKTSGVCCPARRANLVSVVFVAATRQWTCSWARRRGVWLFSLAWLPWRRRRLDRRRRFVSRRMARARLRRSICVATRGSRFWGGGTTRVWSPVRRRGVSVCGLRISVDTRRGIVAVFMSWRARTCVASFSSGSIRCGRRRRE